METNLASSLSIGTLAARLGNDLVAKDGRKIGPLECILYESTSQRPVWLVASKGPLGTNLILAPASATAVEEETLRADFTEAQLTDEPHVDVGRGLDDVGEHEELCHYFGIPFEADLDVRALRAGDDIPGSESVYELGSSSQDSITQKP